MGDISPDALGRIVLFNQKLRHLGERRGVYRDLVGFLDERHHLEDPGVDGRIIQGVPK